MSDELLLTTPDTRSAFSALRANPYGVLRIILGSVLLLAAALKGHALATGPVAGTGLLGSRWFLIGVVEFELLLGLWLILGLYLRIGWWAALATFTGFGVFSLHSAWTGRESCGCFGTLATSPWITSGFNVTAVAALLWLGLPSRAAPSRGTLRWAALLLALVAIGIPGARLMSGSPGSAIGLVPNETFHDFGILSGGEAAGRQHIFTLVNTTDTPIRIIKTSSSCGCTVASIPDDPIPPGGSVEVPVKADWTGRVGLQMAEVQITTDSPLTQHIRLGVRGTIVAQPGIAPGEVRFGRLQPGETRSRIVELVGGDQDRSVRVLSISSDSENISVHPVNARGEAINGPLENNQSRFLVTITAPQRRGREQARVVFHTDASEHPDRTLTVSADFAGLFTVRPPSLFVNAGQEAQLEIHLNEPFSSGPTVEVSEPELLSVLGASRRDGQTWLVSLRAAKEVKTTVHRAELRIAIGPDVVEVPIIVVGSE